MELHYVHRVGEVRCSALKVCNFDNYGMENHPEANTSSRPLQAHYGDIRKHFST
jgi:hypothetical protein